MRNLKVLLNLSKKKYENQKNMKIKKLLTSKIY
jgi:hypothetical protein